MSVATTSVASGGGLSAGVVDTQDTVKGLLAAGGSIEVHKIIIVCSTYKPSHCLFIILLQVLLHISLTDIWPVPWPSHKPVYVLASVVLVDMAAEAAVVTVLVVALVV